jgi:hypothetical protein
MMTTADSFGLYDWKRVSSHSVGSRSSWCFSQPPLAGTVEQLVGADALVDGAGGRVALRHHDGADAVALEAQVRRRGHVHPVVRQEVVVGVLLRIVGRLLVRRLHRHEMPVLVDERGASHRKTASV